MSGAAPVFAIECAGLSRCFGDLVAVKEVSLQVAPGEVDLGDPRAAYRPATDLPRCDWATAAFAPGVAPPPSPSPGS